MKNQNVGAKKMELVMIKFKAHQDKQGKEKDGFLKFIGHEDYYPILSGGWKLFKYFHWVQGLSS